MSEKELRAQLEVMRRALSNEKESRLEPFWEARCACLPLFKQGIHPAIRATLWSEFRELSQQARQAKKGLEEEACAAAEEMEAALATLEESFSQRDGVKPDLIERMSELRRELIKADIPVSEKNRLLERVGAIGAAKSDA